MQVIPSVFGFENMRPRVFFGGHRAAVLLISIGIGAACAENKAESDGASVTETGARGLALVPIVGDRDYCSTERLCQAGEGDCEADHCAPDLVCGENNGPRFGFSSSTDACVDARCVNGVQDGAEEGIDCGGPCGSCLRPASLVAGGGDFCSDLFPCVLGEGDCDADSQCLGTLVCGEDNGPRFGLPRGYDACERGPTALPPGDPEFCTQEGVLCDVGEGDCERDECRAGLVCGEDNGPRFGLSSSTDACVDAQCTNGVQDPGEEASDCGGPCGACARPETLVSGSPHFCSVVFPCDHGEGDCDSDLQCSGSLVCGDDNGPRFGLPRGYDACERRVPMLAFGHADFCAQDGFLCLAGEGDCEQGQCADGLVCGSDNGPRFGFSSSTDACVDPRCLNGQLDPGEDAVDCGGACGACRRPESLVSGGPDHCSVLFPCGYGAGDCDADNQCHGGLVCGDNNGTAFGLPRGYDACALPEGTLGAEVIYDFLDAGTLSVANQALEDCWDLPRSPPACLPGLPTWQENPFNEKYWRFLFYGLRPLRHLLFAYRSTGDVRYRDKLLAVLESFVQGAPNTPDSYLWDKHTSAFRGMSLVNIVQKLRASGDLDAELDAGLVAIIEETGTFLFDPKNFEASFNHGVTEAAALLLIAVNFPQFSQSEAWREVAIERLNNLVFVAVDEDGVEVEQSPFYHFYVLVFFWQIQDWASVTGVKLTPFFDERIANMVRYATLIAQPNGLVPMLGSSVQQSIRTYQRTVFDRLELQEPEFRYVRSAGREGIEPSEKVVLFPSSGQAILRSGFGPVSDFEDQAQLIFDIGPYRTAHSHLDALNIHFYGAGRTVLEDPGLYTYERGDRHDYYWSTRAHNTVVVDGLDQPEGTGVAGRTIAADGWSYQSGFHELYEGVRHARGVALIGRSLLVVVDRLESQTAHEYTQTWHLAPDAVVSGDSSEVFVQDAKQKTWLGIHQASLDPLAVAFKKGETAPRQGWHSSRYEQEAPAYALEYRRTAENAAFATVFGIGPLAEASASVDLTESFEGIQVAFSIGGVDYVLDIAGLGTLDEEVSLVWEDASPQ